MLWTRLKMVAVVVLAVAATTAGGAGLARAGRGGRGDEPGAEPRAVAAVQADAEARGRAAAGGPGGAEAPLEGRAVDAEGRPLPGVDYYLSQGLDPAGGVPTLARATTDADGRYRLEGPGLEPAWRKVGHVSRALFAYRPGLALVATVVPPPNPEVARRPLGPARRRTVTLRGADGRPIAGARIAPCALTPVPSNYSNYSTAAVPDELADRLEATTDADGRAALDCLAPDASLLGLRVAIPGVGTQVVATARPTVKDEAVTVELKPAGRLAGRVRRDDGRPAAGATVEVWSRAGNYWDLVLPVRFEAGPPRTDADGTFRTPPALLAGVKYRALIWAEGSAPALTDYFLPAEGAGAETALPDVVLAPLRTVTGRVIDLRGGPVAGARVVAGGAGAATTTDERGRFRLDGVPRDRALLVFRRDGFRADGRLLGPGDGGDAVEFALARSDEPPTRVMATRPYPIPPEERVRLARRMLDPLVGKVIARGDDSTKHWTLRALMTFDPAAALDLLGRINFRDQDYSRGFLGGELARRLAPEDPDRATAVAEGIAPATWRADALLSVADRLPADQRARRLVLVDRALAAARAEADPEMRLVRIGDVADHLLDLGEAVQAKALFDECRALYAGLAFKYPLRPIHFLIRLGRADLPSSRELIEKIPGPGDRALIYGNIAARLAAADPVEAERLLGIAVGLGAPHGVALRVCQEMARADLPRARRIALARATAFDRAEALLFAAGSLPASGRAAARGLVREAMAEADGPSDGPLSAAASLPALMPLVEPIDPALVPELFWRGVAALAPENDPRVDFGLDDVLRLAPTLARYDRTVAAALFEPVMRAKAAEWKKANETPITVILALVSIDPRRAVEAVEAMPEPDGTNTRGSNWARIRLAMLLGKDDEAQLWRAPSGMASSVLGQGDILH